jgi:quinol-cytochrome oxidoreductase complex cytochrome b subunit
MLRRWGPDLGTAVFGLFLIQIAAGFVSSLRYRADLATAHDSVVQMHALPAWRFLAGFHYWTSAAMIAAASVCVLCLLWTGQYRWQTRAIWWCCCGLLLCAMAAQISGNLLPSSQHDVRTAVAEAQIAGGSPVAGDAIRTAMLRGGSVSTATLGAWYFVHRFVVPAAASIIGIFLVAARREVSKSSLIWMAVLGIGACAAAGAIGAPLGPKAQEFDLASGATRPMWYVLPLHALLSIASERATGAGWIGSMLIPCLVVLCAAIAPWFSRRGGDTTPALGRLWALAIVVFVFLAYLSYGGRVQPIDREPPLSTPSAPVARQPAAVDLELARLGRSAFLKAGCMNCHKVGGEGSANTGPNLAGAGKRFSDRAWLVSMLKDPAGVGLSRMPSFDKLSAEQLNAIAEYVRSLK